MKFIPEQLDPITRRFVETHPGGSAIEVTSRGQQLRYLLTALLLLLLLKFRWDYFLFFITAFLMFWYAAAVIFRGGAAVLSWFGRGEEIITDDEVAALSDDELPGLHRLPAALPRSEHRGENRPEHGQARLPEGEARSHASARSRRQRNREALARTGLPPYCRVLTVPDAPPKTKPRACNYGLSQAKGVFSVIYDAEDAPEPDQLKKACIAFRRDPEKRVLCVQGKLNYFNSRHNLLTRLFTVEYSTYFDLTLPGYQLFNLPLPLGGTNNHFRTDILRKIGGWDPFNVTEDCDLGLRIYEYGYKTRLINSTTYEEANSQVWNWMRQRSRWVKGFIQTHLVHYRNPFRTMKRLGVYGAFGDSSPLGAAR
ncbi:MAG: glycosyltransferase family 2 protein [Victivallis sp.]